MDSQVPAVSSLTSSLSQDIDGFSIGDEKSVTLTNTSVNVQNSTVHIGNIIQHHHHVPLGQVETRDDSSAPNENELYPEKYVTSEPETINKYDIFAANKRICIVIAVFFLAIFLTISILLLSIIHVPTESNEAKDENVEPDPKPSQSFGNLTELNGCRIFEEEDWGMKRNLEDIILKHPIPLFIISHSVTPFCNSTMACKKRISQIQEYHISIGSPDIGYNFVVGGDGNIYVGRGWNARNFHLGNHSVGINFIGNYFRDELTPRMIQCAKGIMAYGVKSGIVENDYKIVCHNQTNANMLSPGPNIYAEVKNWPHFMAGAVSRSYLYGE